MANHPHRKRGPYTVAVSGDGWAIGPHGQCDTLHEAREWARSYGRQADRYAITDAAGAIVERQMRDRSGDGLRWYRAEP